jgi:hypothetical protein
MQDQKAISSLFQEGVDFVDVDYETKAYED